MEIACLDLEGVLVPEIWVAFANKTGIEALKRTTRDEPDYDLLMQYRLNILRENNLTLGAIKEVIKELDPLDGAREFLHWLKERFQVVILSDTFYEFAQPLMKKLDYPALLCHELEVDQNDFLIGCRLRQSRPKRQAVVALKSIYYKTIAAGDSYNDIEMLREADSGILFRAPQNVIEEFPEFPAVHSYDSLKKQFLNATNRDLLI
jgi:phosphoserine/homoserine phosphotransferase